MITGFFEDKHLASEFARCKRLQQARQRWGDLLEPRWMDGNVDDASMMGWRIQEDVCEI